MRVTPLPLSAHRRALTLSSSSQRRHLLAYPWRPFVRLWLRSTVRYLLYECVERFPLRQDDPGDLRPSVKADLSLSLFPLPPSLSSLCPSPSLSLSSLFAPSPSSRPLAPQSSRSGRSATSSAARSRATSSRPAAAQRKAQVLTSPPSCTPARCRRLHRRSCSLFGSSRAGGCGRSCRTSE